MLLILDGTDVATILDRPIDVTVLDKVMMNQLSECETFGSTFGTGDRRVDGAGVPKANRVDSPIRRAKHISGYAPGSLEPASGADQGQEKTWRPNWLHGTTTPAIA